MSMAASQLLRVVLFCVAALASQYGWSHETPIALLEIRETSEGSFVPPTAVFPDHCTFDSPRLECGKQGLFGQLSFERLGLSYSAVVVRISRLGQAEQSFTLTGAEPAVALTPDGQLPLSQVFASYVPLGIEHILLGVDHLLFVLGLIWLVKSFRSLIETITAFTVAHSLTLAAATFGWIGVPESAVNAAIALSIVIVAIEVLRDRQGEPSWTARFPWAVSFGFGLLHGFGFASALTDIGLPEANVPSALLFFNIRVELG